MVRDTGTEKRVDPENLKGDLGRETLRATMMLSFWPHVPA